METINHIIWKIAEISLILVALKAMIIGSEFDFILWLKYRKIYSDWYDNRNNTFPE